MRGANLASLPTFYQWDLLRLYNGFVKSKRNGQRTQTTGWLRPNAAEIPQTGGVKDTSHPKGSVEQSGSKNSAQPALQKESTKNYEELPSSDPKPIGQSSVESGTEDEPRISGGARGSNSLDAPIPDSREKVVKQPCSQHADQSRSQDSQDLMPQTGSTPNINLKNGHHSSSDGENKSVNYQSVKDRSPSPKIRPVLSMVSAWLESIQEHQDFSEIVRACKGFGDQEVEDTNGHQSQRDGTASECRDGAKKAHYARGKQKTSTLGGSQGESSSAKLKNATQSSDSRTKNFLFACSFFKKDKRLYSSCSNTRISSIGHLAEHLRKFHCRGEACCHSCWITFGDMELLAAHATSGSCQPTNGKPPDTLEMPRTQKRSPEQKWYDIFRQLFPNVPKEEEPKSPYWQSYEPTAAELIAYIRTNLPTELIRTAQVENIETVLGSVTALCESFLHNNADSSSMQQLTPASSSSSNDEGRSATNTASESHQTHVGSSWTVPSNLAPTHGRESSLSQPTPSSLGGELTLHTAHSRQAVEARQQVPSLLPAFPQSSEGSSSPLTVVGPAFHSEMVPEENLSDGTDYATPIVDAGSETNSRQTSDAIRPGDALYQPGNDFDFAGPCPEDLQPGQVDLETLNFEPHILFEPEQEFDSAENVRLEEFEFDEFLNIDGS
ncbi:hypothetical protein PG984_008891 [Apiospora sp. TS-2023a]